MQIVGALVGLILIVMTLVDGFETILQPRRVTHRFRFARLFYRSSWSLWHAAALGLFTGKRREAFLSIFAPLSLLGLFATWVIGLIFGFAFLQASAHTDVRIADGSVSFGTYLYLSGTTFFMLGYGDVTPITRVGRILTVGESGLGFGFLAVIISYLPVLSQAFSRREVTISLLDARAGSPPSAGQALERWARLGNQVIVDSALAAWEIWAAELLERLLRDELTVRSRHNLVQAQLFSEKLKQTLNGYHNRAISTMEVIEELIKLAKDLDAATKRGEELGLTDDEVAFYDALASNDSAVQAMGDDKLKVIAAELIRQVKKSVTIDWTLRESARARIKVMVKRILKKHGHPPDLQDEAVKTVLAQAELLCAEWV